MTCSCPRFYRLTETGKRLFGVKDGMDGRRMHYGQIPLDWFNDPAVIALPDSQRFPFMGVGFLMIRRGKLQVTDELPRAVRKAVQMRTAPDFAVYMAQGLIELEPYTCSCHRLEEIDRREEIEEKRIEAGAPAPPPPAAPPPTVETSTPGEHDAAESVALAKAHVLAMPSWNQSACGHWIRLMGPVNKAQGARITNALKPIVQGSGKSPPIEWTVVEPLWVEALEEAVTWSDPGRFTPEVFARTFLARMKQRSGLARAPTDTASRRRDDGDMAMIRAGRLGK